MNRDEVEAVARAFYESLDEARGWHREPERLKEWFRKQARVAIAAIDEHKSEVEPLVVPGGLEAARSYLIEAQEVKILLESTFRAILRGSDHIFDAANHDYFQLVGHRDLFGRSVREALPEVAGQGYYELLDHVYTTGQAFVGNMLPIRFQKSPGAAFEEHLIDFVYRPIKNKFGDLVGVFVEGCDRTAIARS